MAYSEALAERMRTYLFSRTDVEEKKMMGGLVFMIDGKMCVGIIKDELMCRIDPARHEESIDREGCRTMDFTHKPMLGYVLVDEGGMGKKRDFAMWMELALAFNKFAKASKKRS